MKIDQLTHEGRCVIIKNNNIVTIIIVAVVVGALGFFGGMQYQKMQLTSGSGFATRQGGAGRFGGAGGAGGNGRFVGGGANRPVMGQIVSSDPTGITVKMSDGSTKIVVVSGSTSINKAATATKDDLKTGQTVAVFGTANSDGSVTAQNIQLNPQIRAFGRPSGTPSGAPTQQ
ncbi:MAG TPA: DUF5666 domain-containing protein [Patescibacteria group bacterium]|nr:DUF5666 domain-containing protein [Patescibacteria group bacterium]